MKYGALLPPPLLPPSRTGHGLPLPASEEPQGNQDESQGRFYNYLCVGLNILILLYSKLVLFWLNADFLSEQYQNVSLFIKGTFVWANTMIIGGY